MKEKQKKQQKKVEDYLERGAIVKIVSRDRGIIWEGKVISGKNYNCGGLKPDDWAIEIDDQRRGYCYLKQQYDKLGDLKIEYLGEAVVKPVGGICQAIQEWKNQETALVMIWITSERWLKEDCEELVASCYHSALNDLEAIKALQDELISYFESDHFPEDLGGLYQDLLKAAIAAVDWKGVATYLVEMYKEKTEGEFVS